MTLDWAERLKREKPMTRSQTEVGAEVELAVALDTQKKKTMNVEDEDSTA